MVETSNGCSSSMGKNDTCRVSTIADAVGDAPRFHAHQRIPNPGPLSLDGQPSSVVAAAARLRYCVPRCPAALSFAINANAIQGRILSSAPAVLAMWNPLDGFGAFSERTYDLLLSQVSNKNVCGCRLLDEFWYHMEKAGILITSCAALARAFCFHCRLAK
eukprot:5574527-Amphidinium_carterae.1